MAAVQSLRHEAMAAGNLKQTPQCRCVIQTSGETISILPAEPQAGLRAGLQPRRLRGVALPGVSALLPSRFRSGSPTSRGSGSALDRPSNWRSFGPLWGWGWVDWGHHDIAVDPGRYALASGGRPAFSGSVWMHDPAHRGGAAYAGCGNESAL